MASGTRRSHRGILFVFVLAIFGYLLFIFLGPFLLGPWILVVAAVLGLAVVYAARRHVHRRGRLPHVDFTFGWRRHPVPSETSLSKEVAFTFMLGTFAGFLIVLGAYLQLRYPTLGNDAVLYMLGGALVQLAVVIGLGILAEADPRYAMGIPFIVDDSTDDR